MLQPEGFVLTGKENKVCHLKMSLYGLKQSPRQWNKSFDNFMMKSGFSRSKYDQCVCFKHVKTISMIYLLLYTDYILITCTYRKEISKLKSHFKTEFDMKVLGLARMILGIEIKRDRERKLI